MNQDSAIDRIIVSLASASDSADDRLVYFDIDEPITLHLREHIRTPHRHEYQQIMWIRSGTAEHLLDDEVVSIPSGTLIVIPKGHIHRFLPSADARGCFICFDDDFIPHSSYLLFNQFIAQATIPVPADEIPELESLLALIAGESRKADIYGRSVLRHLLRALIARIEELHLRSVRMEARDLSASQSVWERFNILIEQNYKNEHAVTYYARELGISPRKLGTIARLYTGRSTSEIIDNRIILEAKRLILFSRTPIKEIVFQLGFDDPSYFSKVFKRITGLSPNAYRLQQLSA